MCSSDLTEYIPPQDEQTEYIPPQDEQTGHVPPQDEQTEYIPPQDGQTEALFQQAEPSAPPLQAEGAVPLAGTSAPFDGTAPAQPAPPTHKRRSKAPLIAGAALLAAALACGGLWLARPQVSQAAVSFPPSPAPTPSAAVSPAPTGELWQDPVLESAVRRVLGQPEEIGRASCRKRV